MAFGCVARRAVADSLPVARQVELNRRVLQALAGQDDADLARIVHHAAQAGDTDAIVRYGPAAARDAAAAGAHREAVAHYRLVLRHRERFGPATRLAELLERYAVECYTVGAIEAPIVESEAVELRRSLGDQRALGADLRWLSDAVLGRRPGRRRAHRRGGDRLVEAAGDRRLLALALSNQAQLHMLAHRATDCVAVGERAVALARDVGDAAILSHALLNVGSARWQLGDPVAWSLMEESLRVALAAGEVEHACRSCVVLGWHQLEDLYLDDAERTCAGGHQPRRAPTTSASSAT